MKRRMALATMATLAAVLLLVAATTAAIKVAYATSATGTQNPDLTVSISYTPDCVKPWPEGGAQSVSIKNNTGKGQSVFAELRRTRVEAPQYQYYQSWKFSLRPGQTWVKDMTFSHCAGDAGTFIATLSATNRNGTSSATTQYQINEQCP